MLIDDLLNSSQIGNLPNNLLSWMSEGLKKAQKFELAPDFAHAADALAVDFDAVARAIGFCKLPYPFTWIEVPQNIRPTFSASRIHVPDIQSRPKRIGFLLVQEPNQNQNDLGIFRAYQFWNFDDKDKIPNLSEIQMRFDHTKVRADVKVVRSERIIKVEENPMWKKASPMVKSMLSSAIQPWPCEWPTSIAEAAFAEKMDIVRYAYELNIVD